MVKCIRHIQVIHAIPLTLAKFTNSRKHISYENVGNVSQIYLQQIIQVIQWRHVSLAKSNFAIRRWKIHSHSKINACFVCGLHVICVCKAYNTVHKYACAELSSNLCSDVQLEQDVNGATAWRKSRFWHSGGNRCFSEFRCSRPIRLQHFNLVIPPSSWIIG